MRPIIDNDLKTVYIRLDHLLKEKTKLDSDCVASESAIKVINPSGLSADDFILIGDINNDRSEISKINSITGNTISLASSLTQNHKSKDNVSLLKYDTATLNASGTSVASATLAADYYTAITTDIDLTTEYGVEYSNSETLETSGEGGYIYGYERNLCGISDIYDYETPEIFGGKLLSKIDIASKEIRDLFTTQDQQFADLSERDIELLRQPTALLTLYYAFTELIKVSEDSPSLKAEKYQALYNDKINTALKIISKQNDNINVWGQARITR